MKWIFGLLLVISLNVKGETLVSPSAESTKAVVAESEIPVNLDSAKKSAPTENPLMKIMMTLSVVGVLGCAAYFFIRKYMKSNVGKSQANQIKILTQHYLGPKKSLAIIRVAGESILIGITDQNISLIKELSLLDEDIPETAPKNFGSVLNQRKVADFIEDGDRDEENRDEFSISGIKDFVSSKLKNMRTLE